MLPGARIISWHKNFPLKSREVFFVDDVDDDDDGDGDVVEDVDDVDNDDNEKIE